MESSKGEMRASERAMSCLERRVTSGDINSCRASFRFSCLVLQVPLTTFLLTHSYFLFYHMISNFTIRRIRHAIRHISSRTVRFFIQALYIFFLSYVTALMEAVTIANVSAETTPSRPSECDRCFHFHAFAAAATAAAAGL